VESPIRTTACPRASWIFERSTLATPVRTQELLHVLLSQLLRWAEPRPRPENEDEAPPIYQLLVVPTKAEGGRTQLPPPSAFVRKLAAKDRKNLVNFELSIASLLWIAGRI